MLTNLNRLKSKHGERRIRDVITVGGDIVNIYEPTIDQVMQLGKLQERWINEKDKDNPTLDISGIDVIKELFPMLTDIQGIEELSNEEVLDIIDNPSNLFLQVQYALEAVIIETFSTVLKATKRALTMSTFEIQTGEQTEESYQNLLSYMTREHGEELNEFYKAIEQLKGDKEISDIEDLDRLLEENKNIINLQEILDERATKKSKEETGKNTVNTVNTVSETQHDEEPNSKMKEYQSVLNKYIDNFDDESVPLEIPIPEDNDEEE